VFKDTNRRKKAQRNRQSGIENDECTPVTINIRSQKGSGGKGKLRKSFVKPTEIANLLNVKKVGQ